MTDAVPTTMPAARIHAFGGPEQVVVEDVPVPEAGVGEVLVHVTAASLNGADLEIRRSGFDGYFSPPLTLGIDLAGEVVALGPEVDSFAVGDRVHGRRSAAARGTHSAYAAMPADELTPTPAELAPVSAAAVPVVGLAAWQSLFDVGRLEAGDRVLVQGAGGAVGHLAVQFAVYKGAHVVAVDGAHAAARLEALGAHDVLDFRTDDVAAAAGNVQLVVDTVGGPVTAASLELLAEGGRLVTLVGEPDQDAAARRGVLATTIDSWMDRHELARIDELLAAGTITVDVATTVPLSQARRAHELAETGEVAGKIVLENDT